MGSLINTFVPHGTYNDLPHISDVAQAPIDDIKDLNDLCALLDKHHVMDVCIRLVHKHFDTQEGEVMVFENIPIPEHGTIQTMKPVVASGNPQLRGIHYFVNDEGSFQAYEYADYVAPDLTSIEPFLQEFCHIVSKRGLQHKSGLKVNRGDNTDRIGWTEFELDQHRCTIMLQDGMPMPDSEFDVAVTTEWGGLTEIPTSMCKHASCKHCRHCRGHQNRSCSFDDDSSEMGCCIGGKWVVPGTPLV
jgi:hypothetical protein